MPEAIDRFIATVQAQEGAPYVWAGKGEYVAGKRHQYVNANGIQRLVFDCSGLVTWALRRCGWQSKVEFNANRMWREWPHTDKPEAGDLVLYGKPELASHVEVVMPDGRTYGAIGGNSKTLQPTPGACVQWRSRKRSDVLGYVVNPLRTALAAA